MPKKWKRQRMSGADMTDVEVAELVLALDPKQPDHAFICTLARDRIMVLAAEKRGVVNENNRLTEQVKKGSEKVENYKAELNHTRKAAKNHKRATSSLKQLMAASDNAKHKGCTRKVKYTKVEAQCQAEIQGGTTTYYKCAFCLGHHLTSNKSDS